MDGRRATARLEAGLRLAFASRAAARLTARASGRMRCVQSGRRHLGQAMGGELGTLTGGDEACARSLCCCLDRRLGSLFRAQRQDMGFFWPSHSHLPSSMAEGSHVQHGDPRRWAYMPNTLPPGHSTRPDACLRAAMARLSAWDGRGVALAFKPQVTDLEVSCRARAGRRSWHANDLGVCTMNQGTSRPCNGIST